LAAGDATVQSTFTTGAASTALTFASLGTRAPGATVNFVTSGGTNGTTNKISFTTSPGTNFVDPGEFFGGSNYAIYTGAFERGISYGSDTGAVTSAGGTSVGSTLYQQITGNVTAEATNTFTTFNIAGNDNLTIGTGNTVTVSGILKSGNVAGGATISGGTIQAAGGTGELVIRTDGANDALTISSVIAGTGATNFLTKSGAGTLTLSGVNTFQGDVFLDGGTLITAMSANTTVGNLGSQAAFSTTNKNLYLSDNAVFQSTTSFFDKCAQHGEPGCGV